jgi:hypothetical protein
MQHETDISSKAGSIRIQFTTISLYVNPLANLSPPQPLWRFADSEGLQYVDTLARDLGLNTNRKSNPFSEMFLPYHPRDWRGLIPEFLQAEKEGRPEKAGSDSVLERYSSFWLVLQCFLLSLFGVVWYFQRL